MSTASETSERPLGAQRKQANGYYAGKTPEQVLRGLLQAEQDHAVGELSDADLNAVQSAADLAQERLVIAHQPLVRSIARRYCRRDLDLDDLVSQGNLALIRAARSYGRNGRSSFGAYAYGHVMAEVARAADVGGFAMRVPQRVAQKVRRLQRLRSAPTIDGRHTDRWYLSAELGVSIEEFGELERLSVGSSSLSAPVGDGTHTLGDLLYFRDQADLERQEAELALLPEELRRGMASLDADERKVVRLLYGLDIRRPRSLAEVGEHFDLPVTRIRVMHARALSKLRRSDKAPHLRDLLDLSSAIRHSTTADNVRIGLHD